MPTAAAGMNTSRMTGGLPVGVSVTANSTFGFRGSQRQSAAPFTSLTVNRMALDGLNPLHKRRMRAVSTGSNAYRHDGPRLVTSDEKAWRLWSLDSQVHAVHHTTEQLRRWKQCRLLESVLLNRFGLIFSVFVRKKRYETRTEEKGDPQEEHHVYIEIRRLVDLSIVTEFHNGQLGLNCIRNTVKVRIVERKDGIDCAFLEKSGELFLVRFGIEMPSEGKKNQENPMKEPLPEMGERVIEGAIDEAARERIESLFQQAELTKQDDQEAQSNFFFSREVIGQDTTIAGKIPQVDGNPYSISENIESKSPSPTSSLSPKAHVTLPIVHSVLESRGDLGGDPIEFQDAEADKKIFIEGRSSPLNTSRVSVTEIGSKDINMKKSVLEKDFVESLVDTNNSIPADVSVVSQYSEISEKTKANRSSSPLKTISHKKKSKTAPSSSPRKPLSHWTTTQSERIWVAAVTQLPLFGRSGDSASEIILTSETVADEDTIDSICALDMQWYNDNQCLVVLSSAPALHFFRWVGHEMDDNTTITTSQIQLRPGVANLVCLQTAELRLVGFPSSSEPQKVSVLPSDIFLLVLKDGRVVYLQPSTVLLSENPKGQYILDCKKRRQDYGRHPPTAKKLGLTTAWTGSSSLHLNVPQYQDLCNKMGLTSAVLSVVDATACRTRGGCYAAEFFTTGVDMRLVHWGVRLSAPEERLVGVQQSGKNAVEDVESCITRANVIWPEINASDDLLADDKEQTFNIPTTRQGNDTSLSLYTEEISWSPDVTAVSTDLLGDFDLQQLLPTAALTAKQRLDLVRVIQPQLLELYSGTSDRVPLSRRLVFNFEGTLTSLDIVAPISPIIIHRSEHQKSIEASHLSGEPGGGRRRRIPTRDTVSVNELSKVIRHVCRGPDLSELNWLNPELGQNNGAETIKPSMLVLREDTLELLNTTTGERLDTISPSSLLLSEGEVLTDPLNTTTTAYSHLSLNKQRSTPATVVHWCPYTQYVLVGYTDGTVAVSMLRSPFRGLREEPSYRVLNSSVTHGAEISLLKTFPMSLNELSNVKQLSGDTDATLAIVGDVSGGVSIWQLYPRISGKSAMLAYVNLHSGRIIHASVCHLPHQLCMGTMEQLSQRESVLVTVCDKGRVCIWKIASLGGSVGKRRGGGSGEIHLVGSFLGGDDKHPRVSSSGRPSTVSSALILPKIVLRDTQSVSGTESSNNIVSKGENIQVVRPDLEFIVFLGWSDGTLEVWRLLSQTVNSKTPTNEQANIVLLSRTMDHNESITSLQLYHHTSLNSPQTWPAVVDFHPPDRVYCVPNSCESEFAATTTITLPTEDAIFRANLLLNASIEEQNSPEGLSTLEEAKTRIDPLYDTDVVMVGLQSGEVLVYRFTLNLQPVEGIMGITSDILTSLTVPTSLQGLLPLHIGAYHAQDHSSIHEVDFEFLFVGDFEVYRLLPFVTPGYPLLSSYRQDPTQLTLYLARSAYAAAATTTSATNLFFGSEIGTLTNDGDPELRRTSTLQQSTRAFDSLLSYNIRAFAAQYDRMVASVAATPFRASVAAIRRQRISSGKQHSSESQNFISKEGDWDDEPVRLGDTYLGEGVSVDWKSAGGSKGVSDGGGLHGTERAVEVMSSLDRVYDSDFHRAKHDRRLLTLFTQALPSSSTTELSADSAITALHTWLTEDPPVPTSVATTAGPAAAGLCGTSTTDEVSSFRRIILGDDKRVSLPPDSLRELINLLDLDGEAIGFAEFSKLASIVGTAIRKFHLQGTSKSSKSLTSGRGYRSLRGTIARVTYNSLGERVVTRVPLSEEVQGIPSGDAKTYRRFLNEAVKEWRQWQQKASLAASADSAFAAATGLGMGNTDRLLHGIPHVLQEVVKPYRLKVPTGEWGPSATHYYDISRTIRVARALLDLRNACQHEHLAALDAVDLVNNTANRTLTKMNSTVNLPTPVESLSALLVRYFTRQYGDLSKGMGVAASRLTNFLEAVLQNETHWPVLRTVSMALGLHGELDILDDSDEASHNGHSILNATESSEIRARSLDLGVWLAVEARNLLHSRGLVTLGAPITPHIIGASMTATATTIQAVDATLSLAVTKGGNGETNNTTGSSSGVLRWQWVSLPNALAVVSELLRSRGHFGPAVYLAILRAVEELPHIHESNLTTYDARIQSSLVSDHKIESMDDAWVEVEAVCEVLLKEIIPLNEFLTTAEKSLFGSGANIEIGDVVVQLPVGEDSNATSTPKEVRSKSMREAQFRANLSSVAALLRSCLYFDFLRTGEIDAPLFRHVLTNFFLSHDRPIDSPSCRDPAVSAGFATLTAVGNDYLENDIPSTDLVVLSCQRISRIVDRKVRRYGVDDPMSYIDAAALLMAWTAQDQGGTRLSAAHLAATLESISRSVDASQASELLDWFSATSAIPCHDIDPVWVLRGNKTVSPPPNQLTDTELYATASATVGWHSQIPPISSGAHANTSPATIAAAYGVEKRLTLPMEGLWYRNAVPPSDTAGLLHIKSVPLHAPSDRYSTSAAVTSGTTHVAVGQNGAAIERRDLSMRRRPEITSGSRESAALSGVLGKAKTAAPIIQNSLVPPLTRDGVLYGGISTATLPNDVDWDAERGGLRSSYSRMIERIAPLWQNTLDEVSTIPLGELDTSVPSIQDMFADAEVASKECSFTDIISVGSEDSNYQRLDAAEFLASAPAIVPHLPTWEPVDLLSSSNTSLHQCGIDSTSDRQGEQKSHSDLNTFLNELTPFRHLRTDTLSELALSTREMIPISENAGVPSVFADSISSSIPHQSTSLTGNSLTHSLATTDVLQRIDSLASLEAHLVSEYASEVEASNERQKLKAEARKEARKAAIASEIEAMRFAKKAQKEREKRLATGKAFLEANERVEYEERLAKEAAIAEKLANSRAAALQRIADKLAEEKRKKAEAAAARAAAEALAEEKERCDNEDTVKQSEKMKDGIVVDSLLGGYSPRIPLRRVVSVNSADEDDLSSEGNSSPTYSRPTSRGLSSPTFHSSEKEFTETIAVDEDAPLSPKEPEILSEREGLTMEDEVNLTTTVSPTSGPEYQTRPSTPAEALDATWKKFHFSSYTSVSDADEDSLTTAEKYLRHLLSNIANATTKQQEDREKHPRHFYVPLHFFDHIVFDPFVADASRWSFDEFKPLSKLDSSAATRNSPNSASATLQRSNSANILVDTNSVASDLHGDEYDSTSSDSDPFADITRATRKYRKAQARERRLLFTTDSRAVAPEDWIQVVKSTHADWDSFFRHEQEKIDLLKETVAPVVPDREFHFDPTLQPLDASTTAAMAAAVNLAHFGSPDNISGAGGSVSAGHLDSLENQLRGGKLPSASLDLLLPAATAASIYTSTATRLNSPSHLSPSAARTAASLSNLGTNSSFLGGSSMLQSSSFLETIPPSFLQSIPLHPRRDIIPLPFGTVLRNQVILPHTHLRYYQLEVVSTDAIVTIELHCSTGLADLYVSAGKIPSTVKFDFSARARVANDRIARLYFLPSMVGSYFLTVHSPKTGAEFRIWAYSSDASEGRAQPSLERVERFLMKWRFLQENDDEALQFHFPRLEAEAKQRVDMILAEREKSAHQKHEVIGEMRQLAAAGLLDQILNGGDSEVETDDKISATNDIAATTAADSNTTPVTFTTSMTTFNRRLLEDEDSENIEGFVSKVGRYAMRREREWKRARGLLPDDDSDDDDFIDHRPKVGGTSLIAAAASANSPGRENRSRDEVRANSASLAANREINSANSTFGLFEDTQPNDHADLFSPPLTHRTRALRLLTATQESHSSFSRELRHLQQEVDAERKEAKDTRAPEAFHIIGVRPIPASREGRRSSRDNSGDPDFASSTVNSTFNSSSPQRCASQPSNVSASEADFYLPSLTRNPRVGSTSQLDSFGGDGRKPRQRLQARTVSFTMEDVMEREIAANALRNSTNRLPQTKRRKGLASDMLSTPKPVSYTLTRPGV